MTNKSMGDIICALRKEKEMTQKDLADMLNITDKAVSKWERNIAFGVSVEELMNAKSIPGNRRKGAPYLLNVILKAVPTAMGIAVVVSSLLDELDMKSGFTMLGIGLACVGIYQLKTKE